MNPKLNELIRYFEEQQGIFSGSINGKDGEIFMPSSLIQVDSALEKLINAGIVGPNKLFLDAGSGDGRILALASTHSLPAMGIEKNQELFNKSKTNLEYLRKMSVLNGSILKPMQGDFTDDSVYREAGVEFEEIKIIYNFINNYQNIADKISEQSPRGTKFLLYSPTKLPCFFDSKLTHFHTIELPVESELIDSANLDVLNAKRTSAFTSPTYYLHIYEK